MSKFKAGDTPQNKIVITTDGTTTHAKLYDGKTIVRSATAKCSPSDTYDFNIGANLAYDRLMRAETLAATVKPEDKPKTKYNIGDRVNGKYGPGTVICYSKDGFYGVEFDNSHIFGHDCSGIPLMFGQTGASGRCWWQSEGRLSRLDEQEAVKLYCVKDYSFLEKMLTANNVYEIKPNGKIRCDNGKEYGEYVSFKDFSRRNPDYAACLVPLVKRPAKVGEWVYVTEGDGHNVPVGSITKVVSLAGCTGRFAGWCIVDGDTLRDTQYLVLDGYKGGADS